MEPADAAQAFARVPLNRFLGMRALERSAQAARVELAARPEFAQEEGIVHGGVLATLADTAAVHALHPELDGATGMTSIELKLNFLRPARPDGSALLARASVVRRGRRVAVCDVEVEQAGALVAKGLFTYLFLPRAGSAAGEQGARRPDPKAAGGSQ